MPAYNRAVTNMSFHLYRNPYGQLVYISAQGQAHTGVVPVRAFPISAPACGLSLLDADGHELVWIDSLDILPEPIRVLLDEELAGREFMPEIRRILRVSTFATPSIWQVETDRGATVFTLKGEEDIRRLSAQALLIADSHGIHYLIRDSLALDKSSRKLLDRFL